METIKKLAHDRFELFLILSLVLAAGIVNLYGNTNLLFLNVFYLPVLAAGFYLGKRSAVSASLASTLLIFLFVLVPEVILSQVTDTHNLLDLVPTVLIWAAVLNLAAVLVGTLFEHRNQKMEKLKSAYVGVLEVLSKYIESCDRYTQGHSIRVAKYATEIAMAMGLAREDVENVRVAALLHDIGKVDVDIDLIRKSARLTQDENALFDEDLEKGGNLLRLVGVVLDEAIPIVQAHHADYPEEEEAASFPVGARIIAVADAYDIMVTESPEREAKPSGEALAEIEKATGEKFDPAVVKAFKMVRENIPEKETSSVA